MKVSFLTLSLLLASSLSAKDLVYDQTTKLYWADNVASKSLTTTYENAEEYCRNLVIGTHENFRLPSLYELSSLVDYRRYKPAILQGFENVDNAVYWSTTPFADDADRTWAVNFENGKTDIISKSYDRHLRCVESSN